MAAALLRWMTVKTMERSVERKLIHIEEFISLEALPDMREWQILHEGRFFFPIVRVPLIIPIQKRESCLDDIKAGKTDALIETFVGGIAGFNDGASIENCSTVRESADMQGYIVGSDYVGGIVGYNSGKAGALQAQAGSNRNQLHVIGNSYVGGIVGCNAVGVLDDSREPYSVRLAEKETTMETAAVLDWINEGIVTATGDYVGGITGYNGETGLIVNSYSSVDYGDSAEKLAEVSANARFAGGVSGYNKGIITNKDGRYGDSGTDRLSVW